MTEEQIALAKRAVACKGWRWMPGMNALGRLDQDGATLRIHSVRRTSVGFELNGGAFDWRERTDGRWLCLRGGDVIGSPCEVLPDLTDPATLGCLLALVREAWGDPSIIAEPSRSMWEISRSDGCGLRTTGVWGGGGRGRGSFVWTATESQALVAALEAAPCGQ